MGKKDIDKLHIVERNRIHTQVKLLNGYVRQNLETIDRYKECASFSSSVQVLIDNILKKNEEYALQIIENETRLTRSDNRDESLTIELQKAIIINKVTKTKKETPPQPPPPLQKQQNNHNNHNNHQHNHNHNHNYNNQHNNNHHNNNANNHQHNNNHHNNNANNHQHNNNNRPFFQYSDMMENETNKYYDLMASVPQYMLEKLAQMPNNKGYVWRGMYCFGDLQRERGQNTVLFEKVPKTGALRIHEWHPELKQVIIYEKPSNRNAPKKIHEVINLRAM